MSNPSPWALRLLALAVILALVGALASAWAEQDLSGAVSRVSESVFTIKTESGSGGAQKGVGTGFVVSADGQALTCRHVIKDATKITVTLANGDTTTAEVVVSDEALDLALLKLGRGNLPPVTFGSSEDLKSGSDVAAIGAPLGLPNSVTKGAISNPSRELSGKKFIQISATLNPGNSGGPVINSKGEVIGLANAILKDPNTKESTGVGFAIPSALALGFLYDQKVAPSLALGMKAPEPAAQPGEKAGEKPTPLPTPPAPEVGVREMALRLWPLLLGVLVMAVLISALVSLIITRSALRGAQPTPTAWAPGAPPPPSAPAGEDLSDIDITLQ